MKRLIASLLVVSTTAIAQPFDLVTTFEQDLMGDFGNEAVIDGDNLLVGQPNAFGGGTAPPPAACGEVYLVERVEDGYALGPSFSAPDCQPGDAFGAGQMVIQGDLLAVSQPTGSRIDGIGSPADSALHIFRRDAMAAAGWSHVTALTADDQGANQGISGYVRMQGNRLAVLGYTTEQVFGIRFVRANAVYIFERSGAGAGDWQQVQKLATGSSSDFFGFGFDFAGEQLLVGAPAAQTFNAPGQVFVYDWTGSQYEQAGTLPGVADSNFGWYIDVDPSFPDRAVVTAIALAQPGAAHVFERSSGEWEAVQRLGDPMPEDNDLYGVYAQLLGDELAVSAENGMSAANGGGEFFLYRSDDGGQYGLQQSFFAPVGDGALFATRFQMDANQLAVSQVGAQVVGGETRFFVYERDRVDTGEPGGFMVNPGVSGMWFNPDRSGEGFLIDYLNDGRVNVYWYTYDLNGNQLWLFGNGVVDGERVVIDNLMQASGPQFGAAFDPADLVLSTWGSLMLTFADDCSMGQIAWTGPMGYGSGGYEIAKLAAIDNLGCAPLSSKIIANGNGGLF